MFTPRFTRSHLEKLSHAADLRRQSQALGEMASRIEAEVIDEMKEMSLRLDEVAKGSRKPHAIAS